VGFTSARSGHCQQGESHGHQADPGSLALAELEAEEALGEHRQEDESAREHRLADRDRGRRERGHVQDERPHRHAPNRCSTTSSESTATASVGGEFRRSPSAALTPSNPMNSPSRRASVSPSV
jgi:hypothetical protein